MKNPAIYEHLLEELERVYANGPSPDFRQFTVPTSAYLEPSRFEDEQRLLRSLPTPVAHVSQLASPGSCLVHDAVGVPVLVARDREGELVAMLNVCRHRGTRLQKEPGFCRVKKGFRCVYHGWTYDVGGKLTHVPREELFPNLDKGAYSLTKLPVVERFGFVWVVATPGEEYDFDAFLDPLEPDLAPLSLDRHVVFRRGTTTARTNWKVVMEAFLDGYHVRHLHKRTVGPYFEGHQSFSETAGPHVRAIVGRGGFEEAIDSGAVGDIRDIATPTYVFFPNTIFVAQPGFVSRATAYPTSIDSIYWEHDLIIPEAPNDEKAKAHWELNYELIQNGVFEGEDLWVCEQIQQGLGSGANDHFTYGGEEAPIEWWHAELDRRIAEMKTS
jgi:phenylpropionate dioxygenase-like ring-hydroxylating dioxygenase large terminal subunit